MSPVILQYQNVDSLVDGSIAYDGPVITAQPQMALAYRSRGIPACSINELLDSLLSKWNSRKNYFERYVKIASFIDEIKNDDSELLGRAFRHNIAEVYKSMHLLLEIGIFPENMPSTSEEIRFFKKIYSRFLKDEELNVSDFLNYLDEWEDPKKFTSILSTLGAEEVGCSFEDIKAIYFQGFYYMRPMQARLMEAFEKTGVNFFFVNPFESDSPHDYEVWEVNPRFVGLEKEAVDNKRASQREFTPAVLRFEDCFSMVRYLREAKERVHLYAPMTKEIRDMLKTFFLEDPEKTSLLAYPAGRYLMGLYQLWDRDKKELRLDSEILKSCIATGWAGSTYRERSSLLQTFEEVEHYFSNCITVEDWERRLRHLTWVFDQVLPLFKSENPTCRWGGIVASPLKAAAVFGVKPEEAKKLGHTIKQMASDARELFDSFVDGDFDNHFRRIKQMYDDKIRNAFIREMESRVVELIKERVSIKVDVEDCAKDHLQEAIGFLLGGEQEAFSNDSNIDVGDVHGLNDIEASHLLWPNAPVLLAFCDAESLPGKPRTLPWPLNKKFLMQLSTCSKSARYRDDYLFFTQHTALANRYLFHVAKAHPKLELAWTVKRGGKEQNRSIYLSMLDLEGVKERRINSLLLDEGDQGRLLDDCDVTWSQSQALKEYVEQLQEKSDLPLEVHLDLRSCPKSGLRLFYDYGLGRGRGFADEYQLRMLFPNLICVLQATLGISNFESVKRNLQYIYPVFSPLDWQTISDYVPRGGIPEGCEGTDSGFPKRRALLQFFPKYRLTELLDGGFRKTVKDCIYCPHCSYCRERRVEKCNA